MALLYADENFPFPAVEELRRLGHDVLTAHEANQADQGISDELVLAFAHAGGRAILTQNRKHFRNLHNSSQVHSGIVICTVDPDFIDLAIRIHTELDREISTAGSLTGRLIRIVRPLGKNPRTN